MKGNKKIHNKKNKEIKTSVNIRQGEGEKKKGSKEKHY